MCEYYDLAFVQISNRAIFCHSEKSFLLIIGHLLAKRNCSEDGQSDCFSLFTMLKSSLTNADHRLTLAPLSRVENRDSFIKR
jgi:hypothetical protein